MEYLEVDYDTYAEIESLSPDEAAEHLSLKKIGKKIGGAAKKVGGAVGKAGKAVGKTAGKVGKTIGKDVGKAAKATGKAVGKAGKATGKAVGKAAKYVAKEAGKLGEAVALAPLIPLRPVMINALKKNGQNASSKTSTKDLANLFYNNIVKKAAPHYESIDLNNLDEEHILPAIIAIVPAIIDFIKSLKKKKASGQPLTAAEKVMVDETEAIEKKIAAGVPLTKDDTAQLETIAAAAGVAQSKGLDPQSVIPELDKPVIAGLSGKTLLIGAAALVVIILITKK